MSSKSLRDFIKPFIDSNEYKPKNADLLLDIRDEMWIFYDVEFPLTQCSEETSVKYGGLIPSEFHLEKIITEYGATINIYAATKQVSLKRFMGKAGLNLNIIEAPCPYNIFNYKT